MEQRYKPSAARFIAALLLAASAGASNAYDYRDEGWAPDPHELAGLPMHCLGEFRPELKSIPGHSMPTNCGWINHFCPAIVGLNRAGNTMLPMKARVYALQAASGHLEYTRKHMAPTCPLKDDFQALETRARMLRLFVK